MNELDELERRIKSNLKENLLIPKRRFIPDTDKKGWIMAMEKVLKVIKGIKARR